METEYPKISDKNKKLYLFLVIGMIISSMWLIGYNSYVYGGRKVCHNMGGLILTQEFRCEERYIELIDGYKVKEKGPDVIRIGDFEYEP